MLSPGLQNTPIGQRIALALALPIAGFLFFVLWVLAGQQRMANGMRDLRELAELATTVNALVHEVQNERGVAAAYLGSGGKDFAEVQTARQAITDVQVAEFHLALDSLASERFGQSLQKRIAEARPSWAGWPCGGRKPRSCSRAPRSNWPATARSSTPSSALSRRCTCLAAGLNSRGPFMPMST